MTTVRDAIALAESGRTDAARQAFARHIADGAPQAHKSYAPLPAKTSTSLPGASNLPPAERPSSDDDDAGSAEEWEARDGGGFELRIHS